MKKCLLGFLLFVLMMAAATAGAVSLVEWNQNCYSKVQGETTLYDCYADEGDPAAPTDITYTFESFGTLAAGSYVNVLGSAIDGKREISYWDNGKQYAWVNASSIVSASVTVTASDGKKYTIPEACWQNPDAIRAVFCDKYSGDVIEAIIDGMLNGNAPAGGGTGGSALPASLGSVSFTWVDESGEEQPVAMKRLGLVNSVIVLKKEQLTVPTSELRWEADVRPEQAMAVIKAPKSGTATLRNKASSRGKGITKCKTNRIVLVLSSGKNYSKIYYDGMVGYVLTSALKLYPVGGVAEAKDGGEPVTLQTGWISFRGKLKSRNTINIRMNGKNGSRILGDYIAGTPIVIFGQDDKWTEIEVDGYRAFILTEYVTLDEGNGENDE